MNTKLDEISVTMKTIAEKQTSPEISKAWLLFWGTTITGVTAIIVAVITNFEAVAKALGS